MRTVSFLTYSLPAKALLIVVFCLLKWLSGSWVLHSLCWFTSTLFICILSPQGLSRDSLCHQAVCFQPLAHPSIPCHLFSPFSNATKPPFYHFPFTRRVDNWLSPLVYIGCYWTAVTTRKVPGHGSELQGLVFAQGKSSCRDEHGDLAMPELTAWGSEVHWMNYWCQLLWCLGMK